MKDDFRDRSHLMTIDGDPSVGKPRAGRRRAIKDDEEITCRQCEKDISVATNAVVEVTVAPRRTPTGKKAGGTRHWACAYCFARGKLTVLIKG